MGKPDVFIKYPREEQALSPIGERIKDYEELYTSLPFAKRKEQAARCMNCGVPLCQSAMELNGMVSGCPLHNLIPEWNEELYHGSLQYALKRLLKTNPFPEFTGRVCPALCEKACTCGMNDEAVTIHDNERFIIEEGFAKGWMQPKRYRRPRGKRVAIIGSGPSGLSAADTLNRRGHEVHVYEREQRGGGLLMYGIPNMKLDKRIVERRIALMKEEGVVFHFGCDVGKDAQFLDLADHYDAIAFCCGAKAPRPLALEGEQGAQVHYAIDYLSAASEALFSPQRAVIEEMSAQGKRVVIVGGGDTGNDCVATCIRQGCAGVVQLEMMPKPPMQRAKDNPWPQWPRVWKADYGQQECASVFGSDPRIYQSTPKRLLYEDGRLVGVECIRLTMKEGRMQQVEGSEWVLPADMVIIAAGFIGCERYVSDAFHLPLTPRNTILTAKGSHQIQESKYFAAGDMRRGQSLVVWAIAEGKACAREIDCYLMGYSEIESI